MGASRFDIRNPFMTHASIPSLAWEGEVFDIVLRYDDSIVVPVSYANTLPEGVELLTPLDLDGNSLAKVPLTLVRTLHTEDEAEGIMRCIEADALLLSYAR